MAPHCKACGGSIYFEPDDGVGKGIAGDIVCLSCGKRMYVSERAVRAAQEDTISRTDIPKDLRSDLLIGSKQW